MTNDLIAAFDIREERRHLIAPALQGRRIGHAEIADFLDAGLGDRQTVDIALVGQAQGERRTERIGAGPQGCLIDKKAEATKLAAAPALQASRRVS